jgi:hypothetical protein
MRYRRTPHDAAMLESSESQYPSKRPRVSRRLLLHFEKASRTARFDLAETQGMLGVSQWRTRVSLCKLS